MNPGGIWHGCRIPRVLIGLLVAHAAEFSKTAAPFEQGFRSSDARMRKLSLTRGPGSIALSPHTAEAPLAHLEHAAVQAVGRHVELVGCHGFAVELHAPLREQSASLRG